MIVKKLRFRLFISMVLLTIITSIFFIIVSLDKTSSIVEKESLEKFRFTLYFYSSTFEKEIYKTQEAVKAIKSFIESSFIIENSKDKNYMENYSTRVMGSFLSIAKSMKLFDIYLYFNPLIYDAGQLCYYNKNLDGIYEKEPPVYVSKADLTSKEWLWYTKAIENGSYWSDPFPWENFNNIDVISHTKSVIIDDKLVGVVGIDFPFEYFKEYFEHFKLYETGVFFIINSQNKVVVPKNFPNIELPINKLTKLRESDSNYVDATLIYNDLSIDKIVYNDKEYYLAFYKLSNNWIVGAIVSSDEIFEPVSILKKKFFIIFFIVALFALILSIILSKSISDPISKLSNDIKKFSLNNKSIKIDKFNIYELEQLSSVFQNMMRDIIIQSDKLENMKNHFFEILDRIESIIITIDSNEKITFINKGGKYLLKNRDNNLLNEEIYNRVEFFEKYKKEIIYVLKNGKIVELNREYFLDKYFSIQFLPLKSDGGVIIKADDITEFLKIEKELQHSQKMDTIGKLAGGLAHDFKNAINGIIGVISIMHDEWQYIEPENDLKDKIEIIEFSTKRAEEVVKRLLSLSRKKDITLKEVSINQILLRATSIAKSSFDKSIKISLKITSKELMILGDESELEQMILNLLINAAHSMTIMREFKKDWGGDLSISLNLVLKDAKENRVVKDINISSKIENIQDQKEILDNENTELDSIQNKRNHITQENLIDGKIEKERVDFINGNGEDFQNIFNEFSTGLKRRYALITIQDSGIGISENSLDSIFNPYFTTKKEGEGTGLGLSMVYNIVKQHNGFIKVDSQLGIGTIFDVFIPLKD
ncbi:hypothetical protein JXR93_01390 [bacterium]|nr:hypothetical protein [bacterium]